MTQPRQPADRPRRIRGLDATNLCLLFAAARATLPWLFASDAGTSSASRAPAKGVTVVTSHGASA